MRGLEPRTVRSAILAGADLLEVRLDSFRRRDIPYLKKSFKRLASQALGRRTPVILTIRSKREGGVLTLDDRERSEIFNELLPFADIIDVELSSSARLKNVIDSAHGSGKSVIISYHNFSSTPDTRALRGIIKKALAAGADVVKIASRAKSRKDVSTLAGLLLGSPERLIVIAMGRYGVVSRVFFPALGSLVTYGSVTGRSAPGQISVSALKEAFRRFSI